MGFVRFRNYVRHSRERGPELVVMYRGQRDLFRNSWNKKIFLSHLSSFFHEIIENPCVLLSFRYIYRAIAPSSVFLIASDHYLFELCHAILRSYRYKEARIFDKSEKMCDFFRRSRRLLVVSRTSYHFYLVYVECWKWKTVRSSVWVYFIISHKQPPNNEINMNFNLGIIHFRFLESQSLN